MSSSNETTQKAAQQQRAAAIRATLEQVQAELRRTGRHLADAQMELTFVQAWQQGGPQR